MDLLITAPVNQNFSCIARLHAESITEGFLSTLGLPFLSNLYRGISAAPRSGVLVAKNAEMVLGFAAFTADLAACYRSVLTRNFFPIAGSLLPNVFNLSVYRKIFETLLYPQRASREAAQTESQQPRAELLAISVSDQARGHGIGKKLLCAVNDHLRALKITEYFVVTHANDKRSNSLYSGCGFRLVRSFTNHGKPMNEYVRTLPAGSMAVADKCRISGVTC